MHICRMVTFATMAIELITIDFWNTLVSAKSNGALRERARIDGLLHHGRIVNPSLSETAVKQALKTVSVHFDSVWLETARTLSTAELLEALERALNLRFADPEAVTNVLQESLLAGPPVWADGVKDVLAELSKTYFLSIISDTMYSPGRILRQFMRENGVEQNFRHFVFSDEIGCSKPDLRTFGSALKAAGCAPDRALHIGDMKKTDIKGAKSAGMKAVLFTGLNASDAEDSGADAVLGNWRDLPELLHRFRMS